MIYVHAGFPKAASTTIQRFLGANTAFLEECGLLYPSIFAAPDPNEASKPVRAHNHLAYELRRGKPGPAWRRLDRAIEQKPPGRKIILSAEAFTGARPDRLRAALGDAETKVIFYIRDLAKMVVSSYAQQTKTGDNRSDFDRFFERRLPRLDVAGKILAWAETFGAANIRLRLLDPNILAGGDVRYDILEAAGVPFARAERAALEMTEDANPSPGWKTLEILRDLNRSLTAKFVRNEGGGALKRARQARTLRKHSPVLDFAALLWRPAEAIGAALGFSERGQYLTEAQFARAAQAFGAQADALETMGLDARLVRMSREGFVPRNALPSIEHVPAADTAAFLARLYPAAWWAWYEKQEKREAGRPAMETP